MNLTYQEEIKFKKLQHEDLRINCEKCFGFCCVALYFSTTEGFPSDKDAGTPCKNLQKDFSCAVHKSLREKGLKGCTAYDCFGAGQKVAQTTYGGQDWRQGGERAKQMFEVFLIMRQLHEMLWYLTEASSLQATCAIKDRLKDLIRETGDLTHLNAEALLGLDLDAHRKDVNSLLQQTSELVRTKTLGGKKSDLKRRRTIAGRLDLIGQDLRKNNLRGADLRGALLIGANLRGSDLSGADLVGSDLRDADLRGANLADSIFITQAQINTTRGDSSTRLTRFLVRPAHWED